MKKVFVAVPAMDEMDTRFVASLVNIAKRPEVEINFSESSLVYAARNQLISQAIYSKADYILWLDSDMMFAPDILDKFLADIQGRDMVSGLAFARRRPFNPCIFKTLEFGLDGTCESEKYLDYPAEMFEVAGCGLAACIMTTAMATKIVYKFGEAFGPLPGVGEDLSFCIRAKELGYKIYCDPQIKVGHVAKTVIDESVFRQYNKDNTAV